MTNQVTCKANPKYKALIRQLFNYIQSLDYIIASWETIEFRRLRSIPYVSDNEQLGSAIRNKAIPTVEGPDASRNLSSFSSADSEATILRRRHCGWSQKIMTMVSLDRFEITRCRKT
jgi:hypothetical protein